MALIQRSAALASHEESPDQDEDDVGERGDSVNGFSLLTAEL